ncbi:MAG TPA: HAD family phosphatase [Acidocella sp.]|jgi:HAD superfamily hydrolase (TIGR01509 family)|nr:HAD family phosphatase [Acidocella sp.]OYV49560.1 MAG: HAD family hydrolase [Acidocella sp. 20-58-15]HQT38329.1 HAD family phosphatase [Acidocella sp.]
MIKAVIFDMDGVLIEAKDWHYEALNRALRLFGYEISRYDHLTTFDGLPTKKKLQMLSAVYDLPVMLHDFINELKQLYTMEIIYAHCKPQFNHEYALSRLRAEGYRLGVCSNSVRSTIDVMMEKSALLEYLELTVSNQDVTRPKPDPEMYALAIGKMGLSAAECLIVEDHDNGIKAAIAAGAHVMAVRETTDVTYNNIIKRITEIEQGLVA